MEMYFEDPFDLIHVFRAIETQNLNALMHLETLAQPMTNMVATIETAEEQIKFKAAELSNEINQVQVTVVLFFETQKNSSISLRRRSSTGSSSPY